MSVAYFVNNFKVNTLFYIQNSKFPILFTFLVAVGGLLKGNSRERIALATWLVLFWGIFLFFYAGSYNYGADVRFSLLSAMPVALLAGNGAAALASTVRGKEMRNYVSYSIACLIIFSFEGRPILFQQFNLPRHGRQHLPANLRS